MYDFQNMIADLRVEHVFEKRLLERRDSIHPFRLGVFMCRDVREDFLERLLKLQLFIQQTGPEEVRSVELITMDELRFIRKIWLNEKHEFDDSLPRIYKKVMGIDFEDNSIVKN